MHLLIPHASALSEQAVHVLRELALPNLARALGLLTPQPPDTGDEATLSPPHERALAHAWGWQGDDGRWPFAARAAAADGIAVGDLAWGLLTPAHWHVGRDQVVLSDPTALQLDEDESRTFFDAVRDLFESRGLRIEWGAPLRWYIAHDSLAAIACASLDRVIARPIEPWLRTDQADPAAAATGRQMRGLQSEWQMLLYPHPANEAREQRGALPLNSFWLSGCGRHQPSDARTPQIDERLRTPLLGDDWVAWGEAWRALDSGPIAQLLAQAQSGEPTALTVCGERSAQRFDNAVPRPAWRRVADRWRRVEPHAVLEAL